MSDRITARDLDGHPFLIKDMGWAATLERLAELEDKETRGKWIFGGYYHKCSKCYDYAPFTESGEEYLSDFCPNCGATMEG